jgi:hypothetical protein
MTRLSCHRFRGNKVRLWLSILAYNLGNLCRRLGLPGGIKDWSLTSLQQRLIKTGVRLVKHAWYYWLLLAEGHLTRGRFVAMLRRITLLPLPASQHLGSCANQIADSDEGGSGVREVDAERCRGRGEFQKGTASLRFFWVIQF